MDAERVRADVAALAEAVAGWNGGPWDPVVVEARQLLATAATRDGPRAPLAGRRLRRRNKTKIN